MAQEINLKIKVDPTSGNIAIEGFEGKIKKLGQTSDTTFGKMDKSFSAIGGKWASLAAAGGLTLVGKDSFDEFTKYNSALTDMAKVTDESFGEIQRKIKEINPVLGSQTDLLKGYYQIMSAGVTDPVKAMDMLTASAKLAKESHIEQESAVLALTKVMAGYGGELKKTSEAADMLQNIERLGQTKVSELTPVIGGLAEISHVLNVNSNELGGSFATISKTAGDTAGAADEYKAILNALIKPTTAMNNLLKEHGYASAGAAIKDKGFIGVLKMIHDATGDNTTALGKMIQRREAIQGFLAIMSDGGKDASKNIAEMSKYAGAADQKFQNWTHTQEAFKAANKNTFVNLAIDLGEKLAPAIDGVLKLADDLAQHPVFVYGILSAAGLLVVGGGIIRLVATVKALKEIWGLTTVAVEGAGTAMEAIKGIQLSGALSEVNAIGAAAGVAGAAFAGWNLGKFIESTKWAKKNLDPLVQEAFNFVGKIFGANDMNALPAGATLANGSHAGGLDFVPFDGYKAILHKGEGVLTAAQNAVRLAGSQDINAPFGTYGGGMFGSGLTVDVPAASPVAPQGAGGKGSLSVGEININLPAGTKADTGQDWRAITRNFIIPELVKAGYPS